MNHYSVVKNGSHLFHTVRLRAIFKTLELKTLNLAAMSRKTPAQPLPTQLQHERQYLEPLAQTKPMKTYSM